MRRTLLLVIGFSFGIVNSATADDLVSILKEAREVRRTEFAPLQKESAEATAHLNIRMQEHYALINGLRTLGNPTAEKSRTQEIKRLKSRLALLEQLEELAKSEDIEKVKKEKTAEAQEKIAEINKERQVIDKPTQEKFRELSRKYSQRNKELAKAMEAHFKEKGEADLEGLTRKSINGQFHNCGTYTLYYEDERPACQVSVSCNPDSRYGGKPEKLGEGIELWSLTSRSAALKVGVFNVNVYVQQTKGWDKERVKKAVQQLVDLESLAKIKLGE